MSALVAPQPRTQRGTQSRSQRALRERSKLKAVSPPPERMARIPFMAVLIAVFGVGMAGLLMLNTTLQNQAFEGRSLNREANELIYSQAELESAISRRASPQELARRASALGMRPNTHPVFVEVPSGKVIGTPQRVSGKEAPSLVVKTPAELAADRAAAAAKKKAAAVEKAARDRAAGLQSARQAAARQTAAQRRAAELKALELRAAQLRAAQQRATQPAPTQPTPGARPSAGVNR